MTVQVCVSKENLEEVIEAIKSSQEADFDFSGSVFDSSHAVKKIFAAIEHAHPQTKVKFHNCKIDKECLSELTLCLKTTQNLVHVEITGCPREMMMPIGLSLPRNPSLNSVNSVVLDGISPTSEVAILLGNKLIIKEEKLSFFSKHENRNGDDLQDKSSVQPKPPKNI